MAGEQSNWEREQPCLDAGGRHRALRFYLTHDLRLGINTPPGEVATLDMAGIFRAKQLLTTGAVELTHRAGAEPIDFEGSHQSLHRVHDFTGQPQDLVLTAEHGRVSERVGRVYWCGMTPEEAEALAESLLLHAVVARQQQQGRRT